MTTGPLPIPHPRPGHSGHHRRPHPASDGTTARPQRRPPPRRAHARLHSAQPAGRDPHRRSPGPALGPHRPRRPTATTRPDDHAAPSACPQPPSRHYTPGLTARPASRSPLGTTGTTPGWYSPPATAPRWTQPTSGKCSNASPPRQASETGGHCASCASKPGTTSRCVEQRRLGNWPVSAVPPRRLRTPQHPPAARLRWGPRLVTAAAPGATAPARTRRPAPAAGRCRCPGCPAGPRRGSGSPRRRG
jgi:hypothetical protein